MYVEIKIDENKFNELKKTYTRNNVGDYYMNNPYSLKYDPATTKSVVATFGDVWADGLLRIPCGYEVNASGAMYTTCRGNSWGVYRTPSGSYIAFYCGARSMVTNLEDFEVLKEMEVGHYESSGPSDMLWWEDQCDYLVRKGSKYTIDHVSNNLGYIPDNNEDQCVSRAISRFTRQDPSFMEKLQQGIMKGKDPELFLINTFRNKRIDVESFSSQESLAWGLVSEEVRERFLKYA